MTMNKLAAEVLGTFALVFAGTGAIVINDVSGGTSSSGRMSSDAWWPQTMPSPSFTGGGYPIR